LNNLAGLYGLKKDFNLSDNQIHKYNRFVEFLSVWNSKINIVGKSTLFNPVNSHILDSLQITKFINDAKSKIIDIGTGAGLPGLILSIYKFKNVFLVDSNIKKINFIQHVSKELDLSANIIYSRIEDIKDKKFDYIVSRALANLDKLLSYSSHLSHKNTQMIFLKGKKFQDEINFAKNRWKFKVSAHKSLSDERGRVLIITNLKHND